MQRNLQDGLQHYKVLGLPTTASQDDIKRAYKQLARVLHPDKGGSSATFAALQAAFETLINPKTRAVYDALAADVRFKPGAAAPYSSANQETEAATPDAQPPPGVAEAVLLQQLLRTCGGSIDPWRQLCVTCEVCRRPATKECWTCGMAICDFCTRRQHWKGSVPLHWPLVNAPGRMVEQLGKQEFELKRKEDALAYKKSKPGYRPEFELLLLRQFQDAICDLLSNTQREKQLTAVSSDGKLPSGSIKTGSSSSSSSSGSTARSLTAPATASAFSLSANASASNLSIKSSNTGSRDLMTTGSSSALTAPDRNSSSKALALPKRSSSSSSINRCLRAWRAADPEAIRLFQGIYDYRLARFYMWAQTEAAILLAVHLPTGGTSTPPKLNIKATSTSLTVQHQGFAPVLSRFWSHPVATAEGFATWSSCDGQLLCTVIPKSQPGKTWSTCFQGDNHGARCLNSPYSLLQLPQEVQLELELPFWVVPEEDLEVTVTRDKVTVLVDGLMKIERWYWKNEAEVSRRGGNYKVVDSATTNWCILDQQQPPPAAAAAAAADASHCLGRKKQGKVLSLTLGLPELTLEEIQYKKGVRQNNAAATRSCPFGFDRKGRSFFIDDEDEFGLSLRLQALMFQQAGFTWLTAKPWEVATGAAARTVSQGVRDSKCDMVLCGLNGRWVEHESELPLEVQKHLKWLRAARSSG